jgi:hypothetical protein
MNHLLKRNLTTLAAILIVATMIFGIGTFEIKMREVSAYMSRGPQQDDEKGNDGITMSLPPTINTDIGVLCPHLDNGALCIDHSQGSGNRPLALTVPVNVTVPINNTNTNTADSSSSSDATASNTNDIINTVSNNNTLTVPPANTASAVKVPGLGILGLTATMPNSDGSCLKNQIHAKSETGPVCLSISVKK